MQIELQAKERSYHRRHGDDEMLPLSYEVGHGARAPPGRLRRCLLSYSTPNGVVTLLATGNGRCGSYQELLIHVLAAQGIYSEPLNVLAPDLGVATAKADFVATYGHDPELDYVTIRAVFFVKNWTLSTSARWDVADLNGVPGQGKENPLAVFADHALVIYGPDEDHLKIYDPSYGKGPYDQLVDWEDAAVDGFGVQFIDSSSSSAGFKMWTRKLDSKGVPEVDIETP